MNKKLNFKKLIILFYIFYNIYIFIRKIGFFISISKICFYFIFIFVFLLL